MIFYFSGTGNSQMAARQVGEMLQDEVVSINEYMISGKKQPFHSEVPWVFVTPTYAWRIPRVVERWILENSLEGSRDAYFILTCGGSCGNAAAYAKKLCEKKRLHFQGLDSVVMPENYVAMFPTPGEEEIGEILASAKPRITVLAEQIKEGISFPEPVLSVKDRFQSGPVNVIYYPLLVHDKKFTVTGACISCGACSRRCPLGNITMVDKKPRWNGNCTHCMACIGGCPTGAIEYGTKSIGKRRYDIMS